MNKIPLISLIVPVYNVEKYLHKCINSILNQTFSNFELLLINDGSIDQSGKICDYYSKKHESIKVLHQKNQGASSARNLGIDYAVGQYICFIDADDWIELDYLQSFCVDELKNDESIFVLQDILKVNDGKINKYCNFPNRTINYNAFSELFTKYKLYNFGHPFSKLYQTKILKESNIKFDTKIRYSEDLLFMLQYLQYVKTVIFLPSAKYNYNNQNANSLINQFHSFESEFYCFKRIKYAIDNIILCLNLDLDSTDKLYFKTVHYYSRAIQSIYRPRYRMTRKKRISILRDLRNNKELDFLINYKTFKNQRTVKFTLFFLHKRLFKTLDILLLLSYKIKWNLERVK